LVVINSKSPTGEAAQAVKRSIFQQFGIAAYAADCQTLDTDQIGQLLKALLYAFPMAELHIHFPRWMDALEADHPIKAGLHQGLLEIAKEISTLSQAEDSLAKLSTLEPVQDFQILRIDLGSGIVSCRLTFPESLFYEILSSKAGIEIKNDAQLLSLLGQLSAVKQEYDKISDALNAVKATGYGIVMPTAAEMTLETPELLHKGSTYGVKLKAGAPSIHMIRVDIDTEINPMVGGEQQSQDLIAYLTGESPEKLWESNIFGKSVYDLIQEGLTTKLIRTPEEVRAKFRGSLTRIINEGATGLICIIL